MACGGVRCRSYHIVDVECVELALFGVFHGEKEELRVALGVRVIVQDQMVDELVFRVNLPEISALEIGVKDKILMLCLEGFDLLLVNIVLRQLIKGALPEIE